MKCAGCTVTDAELSYSLTGESLVGVFCRGCLAARMQEGRLRDGTTRRIKKVPNGKRNADP